MVARGEAVQVGEKPKLYLAAADPDAIQTPDNDTTPDETAAPETDPTPDDTADAAKPPAARRTTTKTSTK